MLREIDGQYSHIVDHLTYMDILATDVGCKPNIGKSRYNKFADLCIGRRPCMCVCRRPCMCVRRRPCMCVCRRPYMCVCRRPCMCS